MPGDLVSGSLKLEVIVSKVSSKSMKGFFFLSLYTHHQTMTFRKLRILFVHYTYESSFFEALFQELLCPFWVIFRDASCFIHKKVVVFHVHEDIYRVRQRFSKLCIFSQSSISVPFLRLLMTKSGRCVKSKNTITKFIVSPRNIQTIIHIYFLCGFK